MEVTPAAKPPDPSLDVSFVERDDGPMRPLKRVNGSREPGFQVVIQRSALNAIHEHGKSDTSVEVCGVLVGKIHHDRISTYLLITAWIPGDKAKNKNAQVTFTSETWNGINKKMESDHKSEKIVGWYHTHPGFGVFLSGMDLFIQDNFFNLPWQVAHVYDPINEEDGLFLWKAGKSERGEFLIEEDEPHWGHDFRKKLPEPGTTVDEGPLLWRVVWVCAIFVLSFVLTYLAAVYIRR